MTSLILVILAQTFAPTPAASATRRGVVTTGPQTFAGLKTFVDGGVVADIKQTSRLWGFPFCATPPTIGRPMSFTGTQWCATATITMPPAAYEFAPTSGAGMPAECGTGSIASTTGGALSFTRSSVAECYSNDGQTLTQIAAGLPRVSSGQVDSSVLGIWSETGRTNELWPSRDLTHSNWSKTNATCVRATGMRNDANGASVCTSTSTNGTVLYTLGSSASARALSFHIKRVTGGGVVQVTINGSTWIDITSRLSASKWRRVVSYEVPGCTGVTRSDCITDVTLSNVALAGATVGFRMATSGDAVAVDFAQVEASSNGTVTSPIETVTGPETRAAELADLAVSASMSVGFCVAATTIAKPSGLFRGHGSLMNGTLGNPTAGGSFCDSYLSPSWTAETTATSPVSSNTGINVVGSINRWTTFYEAGKLNGCINDVCGAGTTATYTQPSWTRLRVNGYLSGDTINGVMREIQVDSNPSRCRRSFVIDPTTIAAIGDSITSGPNVGVSGWPEVLQSIIGGPLVVSNFAVSGAVVAQMKTNQFDAYVRGRFGTVIILGGINDIRAGTSADTIFLSLSAMYDGARLAGQKVIPVTVLPANNTAPQNAELENLNNRIRTYCVSNGLNCVDAYNSNLRSGTLLNPAYDSGDGLHPNQAGEDYLAAIIQAAL